MPIAKSSANAKHPKNGSKTMENEIAKEIAKLSEDLCAELYDIRRAVETLTEALKQQATPPPAARSWRHFPPPGSQDDKRRF